MLFNPYTPGAGMLPEYLAGRDKLIEEAKFSIDSLLKGYPQRPIIYYGLRGVGKTVLLTYLDEFAKNKNLITFNLEVKENISFIDELIIQINKKILRLSTTEKIKKLIDELRQTIMNFTLTYNIGDSSISFEHKNLSKAILQDNILELILSLGKIAKETSNAVILFLDEIQYANRDELEALITAQHRVNQLKLPVTIIGAGLPRILVTMTESKTYAERMFLFQQIDSLKYEDAVKAVVKPAKSFNITYTKEALDEIYNITDGYPYFIQLLCYLTTRSYKDIDLEKIKISQKIFLEEIDKSFFRVRFDKSTKKEKEFMFAMSECGKLPCTMANVSAILNKPLKNISPVRSSLIKKNLIYPTRYGEIDFTVPQFKEFLKRIK